MSEGRADGQMEAIYGQEPRMKASVFVVPGARLSPGDRPQTAGGKGAYVQL